MANSTSKRPPGRPSKGVLSTTAAISITGTHGLKAYLSALSESVQAYEGDVPGPKSTRAVLVRSLMMRGIESLAGESDGNGLIEVMDSLNAELQAEAKKKTEAGRAAKEMLECLESAREEAAEYFDRWSAKN